MISVNSLYKQYQLGVSGNTTLRESLASLATFALFRKKVPPQTIWALQDVSFAIGKGETVGIIGRNGAGKSTLLKILSKITYPTKGSVDVKGRVAAMLEVGTGFHQELTGRENIYMNGSILGMSRKEVTRKLDAIIEFSGVEKFIDTPIKRYSSGMRLRLGFAVAAHLDADVLIVDEVLAVGDAAFQRKCLNVMGDLRDRARTVIFVSHNLAAVENLCKRCIWIDGGRVRGDGNATDIIKEYMNSTVSPENSAFALSNLDGRRGSGKIRFEKVEFLSPDSFTQQVIRSGDPLTIRLHYLASETVPHPSLGFRIYTDMGTLVTETSTWHHGISIPELRDGKGYLDLEIESLNLLPGKYSLSLWATDDAGAFVYDNVENAVTLEVELANIYGSGRNIDGRSGIVFFPQRWIIPSLSEARQLDAPNQPGERPKLVSHHR